MERSPFAVALRFAPEEMELTDIKTEKLQVPWKIPTCMGETAPEHLDLLLMH
jgi:hypothetical protein